MEEIAHNVACPDCFERSVRSVIVKRHTDTRVKMQCVKCDYIVFDNSVENYPSEKKEDKPIHVMTTILVYIMMLLGYGYVLFKRFCSYLCLRPVSAVVYKRYADHVKDMALIKAQEVLVKSRKATVDFYRTYHPECVRDDGIVNIDVSYDGSWHRRGHNSKFFFGAVIEGHAGLVIDYITLSSDCELCTKKLNLLKKKKWTQQKYNQWYTKHASKCDINYKGSSGSMEPAAAEKLWSRSVDIGFRYVRFISDGDAKTFKTIRDMNNGQGAYGSANQVVKEECINHVSKRLVTHLTNLSKARQMRTGRSLGGQGRLHKKIIDILQMYFADNVRKAKNTSPAYMRKTILATFYHCSSTDEKPRHELCPKDKWCFYQNALAAGKTPKPHREMNVGFTLDPDEWKDVLQVYQKLTTDDLLIRCLRGKTQNPNEHVHSRVWRMCPKHKNVKLRYVDFAAAQAVCNYNIGHEESNLCNLLGLPFTKILLQCLQQQDKRMNEPIKKKTRRG